MPGHQDRREKRFFQGLNTKKVSDVPSSAIASLSDPVSLEGNNKEVLQAISLVNSATMRDGNPIPKSCQVLSFTVTNDTRTAIFTPGKGEVYEILAMQITATGRSGTLVHNLFFQDISGLSTNGNLIKWHVESLTSSDAVLDDDDASRPMVMDENFNLQYQVEGTFTDCDLLMAISRIR